jgi:hypothetical protein
MSSQNQSSKSMRARGSKSGVKNKTPKLPETQEYLGKIGIFLLLNSDYPHTIFDFLQRLSDFREIQEKLLRQLSDFFNGFLLSSTAFRFLQQLSTFREIRKNLSMAASIQKIAIRASYFSQIAIFRDKIIGDKNTKDHYPSFVFSAPSFIILAN